MLPRRPSSGPPWWAWQHHHAWEGGEGGGREGGRGEGRGGDGREGGREGGGEGRGGEGGELVAGSYLITRRVVVCVTVCVVSCDVM